MFFIEKKKMIRKKNEGLPEVLSFSSVKLLLSELNGLLPPFSFPEIILFNSIILIYLYISNLLEILTY